MWKKPYIYVILLVPWQPLLTQYPVSERASLQHVAFGPSPTLESMKITHPVMACSSLKAISVPFDKPPHGLEAGPDWQNTTLPTATPDHRTSHLPPPASEEQSNQGRFKLFVKPHNSTTAENGDYSSAESPDKQRRLPLGSLSASSYAGWPAPCSTCHIPLECRIQK